MGGWNQACRIGFLVVCMNPGHGAGKVRLAPWHHSFAGAEITINKLINPHSYNMIHLMKIGER